MLRNFSRKKANREHMLRNLATSLVLYEKVDTTLAKVKELKPFIDKILAGAKSNDFNTIRSLNKVFFDRNAVKKIVEELVPRYEKRTSGFTRTFHLKNRPGDNSEMMRIELIDKIKFVEKLVPAATTEKKEVSSDDVKVEVKEKNKVKVVKNASK
jgi:large subunit ribosomal protein L17